MKIVHIYVIGFALPNYPMGFKNNASVSSNQQVKPKLILGSLSTCVFEMRTATGRELFSLPLCLHSTTFIASSIFP